MPLYEYRCESGHTFDCLQRFTDTPVERCDCGAPARRVLHAPAIAFKGSGFHNTDYSSSRRAKGATR